jgi:uncharacterized protein YciI
MKHVVFYEPADGIGANVAEHYPAHRKFFEEFHARGDLLMIGPCRAGRPLTGGCGRHGFGSGGSGWR